MPIVPEFAIGKVDAAVGQPDIIDVGCQFLFGNNLAQCLINLVSNQRSIFYPRSGRGAHMQFDLTGVDRGEEIPAKH